MYHIQKGHWRQKSIVHNMHNFIYCDT
uniref:Uncharacterized protein n=1 Tax=Anguilla anguilla TaxID=7936 RepID=A0A0E9PUY1_ANGAN